MTRGNFLESRIVGMGIIRAGDYSMLVVKDGEEYVMMGSTPAEMAVTFPQARFSSIQDSYCT